MTRIPSLPFATILVLAATLPAATAGAGDLATALGATDVAVDLRYRFENVSRDVADEKDAHASTLRTALRVETGAYRHWKVFAEVENVAAVGNQLFANRGAGALDNGVSDRAVVADVALTEFNQAYVELGLAGTRVRLGRQEILLGDVRFVGNVGWRQNHQSFDGLRVDHGFNDRVKLTYAYLDRVNRIFGDRRGLEGHVVEVQATAGPGTLRAYGLSLDWDDAALSPQSTVTVGAELAGSRALGVRKLLYELEWATQRDTGDNPLDVAADYLHGMVGYGGSAATLRLGQERLEAGSGGAFTTPLATLHKFNGWADIFLATPGDGLVDTYLQADGRRGSLAWLARYHDFEAESGSGAHYGAELDGQLLYETPWKQTIALTLALYDADELAVDTDKWMLWTSYSF